MLDTGIDVPEVLNLVFFKRVYSVIKFWQMIGRGTRVCKDFNVFSPSKEFFGKDKEQTSSADFKNFNEKQGFYIFDFCDNFDFFDINPKGKITGNTLSLSQKIFNLKLEMLVELQKGVHQENEEHVTFYNKWKTELISLVKNLNRSHINVRYNLKEVDKYSDEKTWQFISPLMLKEIEKVITPLITSDDSDSSAKVFDAWLFNMELAHLEGDKDYSKPLQKVTSIINALLDMQTIPQIKVKAEILKTFVSDEYWKNVTVSKLESVREEVRELIKFLQTTTREIVETNFEDEILDKDGKHINPQFKNYKQRVIDYLLETTNCVAINKIKNLEPLTPKDLQDLQHILCDELGSKSDYEELLKNEPLSVFVRKIVGLNSDVVTKLFSEYLSKYDFNSEQQEFLHNIVTFVLQNGDIVPSNLVKDYPFNVFDYTELFEGNVEPVYALIKKLHEVIAA